MISLGVPYALAQDDDRQMQRAILFNCQVQEPSGKRYNVTLLSTRTNYRDARIAGNLQAQGGAGNDIRVLAVRGQSVIYDSGRRRSVVISVDSREPGEYVLVFDNSSSVVSPKIVAENLPLIHRGVNAEQHESDKQESSAHYTHASGIIERLYVALKVDERVSG